jgi:hypothetical protein
MIIALGGRIDLDESYYSTDKRIIDIPVVSYSKTTTISSNNSSSSLSGSRIEGEFVPTDTLFEYHESLFLEYS